MIRKKLNDEDPSVTIDVSSICINISYNEGISAISRSLEEAQTEPLMKMFICRLTKQVLTKNYFELNAFNLYIPNQGNTMDTRMLPPMPIYS